MDKIIQSESQNSITHLSTIFIALIVSIAALSASVAASEIDPRREEILVNDCSTSSALCILEGGPCNYCEDRCIDSNNEVLFNGTHYDGLVANSIDCCKLGRTNEIEVGSNASGCFANLNVNIDGDGNVTVDGQEANHNDTVPHEYGSEINVTANPSERYLFEEWLGTCQGVSSETCALTMTENKQISLNLTVKTYTLDTSVVGQGTIEIDPNKNEYAHSENVTLTANPSNGWAFTGWQEDCSGTDNTCELEMTANKTAKANFEDMTDTVFYKDCSVTGSYECYDGNACSGMDDDSSCRGSGSCDVSCPSAPANSTLVRGPSDSCSVSISCYCYDDALQSSPFEEGSDQHRLAFDGSSDTEIVPIGSYSCMGDGDCLVSGSCKYECDDGFVWDSDQNKCVYVGQQWTFTYTGSKETHTLNNTARYRLEVWGAGGGSGTNQDGGKGGYVKGEFDAWDGDTVEVWVGGAGGSGDNGGGWGYYSGGDGGQTTGLDGNTVRAGAGGGSTRVAVAGSTLADVDAGGGGANSGYDSATGENLYTAGGGGARGGAAGTGGAEGTDGEGSGYGGDGGDNAHDIPAESGDPGGQDTYSALNTTSTSTGGGNEGDALVELTLIEDYPECVPGATQSCSDTCYYYDCDGSGNCVQYSNTDSGQITCQSDGTWGSCDASASCPSDSCTYDSDCGVDCSSVCSSWSDDGCGLKPCYSDEMRQSRDCGSYSDQCSESQCVYDSICGDETIMGGTIQ